MIISSPVFKNRGEIPGKYTCNGANVNPPLQFGEVPAGAKSLVLVVDDPDAPGGDWVHWVVYNISPGVQEVGEDSVPEGGIEGNSSFGSPKYGGPCPPPPSGKHRYFFTLYALDATLVFDRPDEVDKQLVEAQMKAHIIDTAELVGLYSQK